MQPTHPTAAEMFSRPPRPAAVLRAVLMAPFIVLIPSFALTHYLAHRFAYHPALGEPWLYAASSSPLVPLAGIVLAGIAVVICARERRFRLLIPACLLAALWFAARLFGPVYEPFDAYRWAGRLLLYGPTRDLIVMPLGLTVSAILIGFAFIGRSLRQTGDDSQIASVAHGSARLATTADLKAAGLLQPRGIRLGAWRRAWGWVPLADNSDAHVLAVMPTGAGKTSSLILPTLLTNLASAFVLDPKGELWAGSAGWRHRQGHRCLLFSPTSNSPHALAWNPFDEIRRGDHEIRDLRTLAENLISTPGGQEKNHWTHSAQRLFQLLALHLLHASETPSFGELRELLNSRRDDPYELFRELVDYPHDPDHAHGWTRRGEASATHPEVALLAQSFLSTPDRELGSILSTLQSYVALWADPIVSRNTSRSDFSLSELADPSRPATLYVAIPYRDLEPLGPMLRILLALLIHHLTTDPAEATAARPRSRTLFLLDEFAALGRVPIFEQMIGFFRGYGIRAAVVVQDLGNLTHLYSHDETISANCRIHVASATQSPRTREHVSRLAGDTTVRYRHRSRSGGRNSLTMSKSGMIDTEARRPLLTPAEVGALGWDRLVILAAGMPPVLAYKYPYFRDQELQDRAALLPPME